MALFTFDSIFKSSSWSFPVPVIWGQIFGPSRAVLVVDSGNWASLRSLFMFEHQVEGGRPLPLFSSGRFSAIFSWSLLRLIKICPYHLRRFSVIFSEIGVTLKLPRMYSLRILSSPAHLRMLTLLTCILCSYPRDKIKQSTLVTFLCIEWYGRQLLHSINLIDLLLFLRDRTTYKQTIAFIIVLVL